MFDTIEDVQKRLNDQGYICGKNIATVVYLATKLDKPVLVEETMNIILKHQGDIEKAQSELGKLLQKKAAEVASGEPQRVEPPASSVKKSVLH